MTTYLRVKEIGEQQGLNITTLSRKAELAYSTAHALWKGDVAQLNIRTLDRVARALNVQVSDLFGDTDEDEADLAAYRAAKAEVGDALGLDDAVAEIERERQTLRVAI